MCLSGTRKHVRKGFLILFPFLKGFEVFKNHRRGRDLSDVQKKERKEFCYDKKQKAVCKIAG